MGGRKNDSRFSHVRELTYLLNAVLAIIFSSEVKLECPTPSRDDSIEIEVVYEMAQTKKNWILECIMVDSPMYTLKKISHYLLTML